MKLLFGDDENGKIIGAMFKTFGNVNAIASLSSVTTEWTTDRTGALAVPECETIKVNILYYTMIS